MEYTANSKRYEEMRYSRCGKSGVLLPKVSLGFWHNFGETTPYERSREIALAAFDNGITHFDLANNYGPRPGAAEERLGQILRHDLSAHRDELFISTKAAYDMWEGPYGTWASRKHLLASLDQSLSRLGLPYVDLFYCHRYDPDTPLDETLQALVDAVRSGRALYVGISRWPLQALTYGIEFLHEHGVPLLIYQGRLNILDRAPQREGILQCLGQEGKGFISFSPLAQGLLTNRYLNGIPAGSRMTEEHFLKSSTLTPQLLARLRSLNDLARQRGETLAQMALAWVLQQPEVTSVLAGVSSVQQLFDNVGCLHCAPFSEEELRLIDSLMS
ncbi:MAG: aldo/keto reductase [Prevotellaceae bacterium]|nr:aldo/keto reductase [Prevotellaceae bacterium]